MDKTLKLVWENNPDTPITASSLSKIVDDYSEGQMVYMDNDAFTEPGFGDNRLKLKAGSKIKLSYPLTSALFDFNESFISHNSEVVPSIVENIEFRIETPDPDKKTIAIESGTTNILTNSSFEDDFTDWNLIYQNDATTQSTIEISSNSLDGGKSAKLHSDSSANVVEIQHDVSLNNNTDKYTISFYIKNTDTCGFLLRGDPDSGSTYWNDANGIWGGQVPLLIPANSDWTRVIIRDISTTALSPTSPKLRLQFYSMGALNDIYIDSVQVEKKSYPTSYTGSTRDNSSLLLSTDLIDLNKGTIELEIRPNNLSEDRTLFSLRTASPSIDAMRLFFNSAASRLVFNVRNTANNSYESVFIEMTNSEYESLIDNWQKIAVTWNKDLGIKLYLNGFSSSASLDSFTPYTINDVTEFQVGRRDTESYAEALFNVFKINLFDKKDTDISDSFLYGISADDNNEVMFENNNQTIILDETMLDTGVSYNINTKYYLWIYVDSIYDDTCNIIISSNYNKPLGINKYLCKKFGGFETDGSGNIILESIWDVVSERNETLHVSKVAVAGTTSNNSNFIVESEPWGPNKVTSNVPTRFTDFIYSGNGSTDFITIDPAGSIKVDELFIDADKISGDGNIIIEPTGILDINSGTGDIRLDNIKIKSNSIYSNNMQDITIENLSAKSINITSGANIIMNTPGENIFNGNVSIASNKSLRFEDGLEEKIQFDRTTGNYAVGRQTDSLYMRTNNTISFYKQGNHIGTKFSPGTGGTILAAITTDTSVSSQIDPNSHFYAGRVHNAVYNDLAECWVIEKDENVQYNKVIVQTENGARQSRKRAEKGTIGVASDTYGFILGDEDFNEYLDDSKKVPIGISGRVKVWCDMNIYNVGDELVSSKHGFATKANIFEKVFKRDRIIGRVDEVVEVIGENALIWIKIQ